MSTLAILGISWYEFENFAQLWLPILFMAVLVYLVWRTLKLMPRTKPQQITPRSASSVTWDDIAGVEETKDELREVVEFLRHPKQFKALGRGTLEFLKPENPKILAFLRRYQGDHLVA